MWSQRSVAVKSLREAPLVDLRDPLSSVAKMANSLTLANKVTDSY